jgi:integrase
METQVILYQADNPLLPARHEQWSKDRHSRIQRFVGWQQATGRAWHSPDLAAWRDDLLSEGLKPSTIAAYLATVRGRYADLTIDNQVRDRLYDSTPPTASPADRYAMVNEMLTRLLNAVNPKTAPIKETTVQDRTASDHLRLTPRQAEWFIRSPGIDTLKGLRDTALIALLLCTGLREGELVALKVSDLRQYSEDGELCVLVQHGKGDKQRLVSYGDLVWCLEYVDLWLAQSGITDGFVFRRVLRWEKTIANDGQPLTTRAIQKILKLYPVAIPGGLARVKPHDCRRTYAKIQYDAGMELLAIQQNLGHSNIATTERYIGELNMRKRRGRGAFRVDLASRLQTNLL